jgi:hypothetical protein
MSVRSLIAASHFCLLDMLSELLFIGVVKDYTLYVPSRGFNFSVLNRFQESIFMIYDPRSLRSLI